MRQKISQILIEVKTVWKDFVRTEKNVRKLTNYEKKEMISLTNKEKELYNKQKVCYICKKEFIIDDDNKKYHKVRGHCH